MKTSGTKPIKNTMRKPSPLKFMNLVSTLDAASKVAATVGKKKSATTDKGTTKGTTTSGTSTIKKKDIKPTTETSIKVKTPTPKPTATTKPIEGKPNASVKPTGKKAIDTVKKVAATAAKGAVAKTALTQLKKHKR